MRGTGSEHDAAPAAEREREPDLVEVRVTTPDRESALRIAHALVGDRLAACVQVVPGVTSVYVWEGEVQEGAEHLLLVKSTAHRFGPIRDRIRDEHPYDTPEVLAVPVADADTRYASWVRETVRPEPAAGPPRPDEDAR